MANIWSRIGKAGKAGMEFSESLSAIERLRLAEEDNRRAEEVAKREAEKYQEEVNKLEEQKRLYDEILQQSKKNEPTSPEIFKEIPRLEALDQEISGLREGEAGANQFEQGENGGLAGLRSIIQRNKDMIASSPKSLEAPQALRTQPIKRGLETTNPNIIEEISKRVRPGIHDDVMAMAQDLQKLKDKEPTPRLTRVSPLNVSEEQLAGQYMKSGSLAPEVVKELAQTPGGMEEADRLIGAVQGIQKIAGGVEAVPIYQRLKQLNPDNPTLQTYLDKLIEQASGAGVAEQKAITAGDVKKNALAEEKIGLRAKYRAPAHEAQPKLGALDSFLTRLNMDMQKAQAEVEKHQNAITSIGSNGLSTFGMTPDAHRQAAAQASEKAAILNQKYNEGVALNADIQAEIQPVSVGAEYLKRNSNLVTTERNTTLGQRQIVQELVDWRKQNPLRTDAEDAAKQKEVLGKLETFYSSAQIPESEKTNNLKMASDDLKMKPKQKILREAEQLFASGTKTDRIKRTLSKKHKGSDDFNKAMIEFNKNHPQ